jgi:DNA-binding PadR family transcriptional regulator
MSYEPSNPLTIPVYQILLSLSDRDMHGYAILRDIEERTAGEVKLAAGTLYAAVARLVREGLIEEIVEVGDHDADARRRYYRITSRGRRAAAADAERMRRFVRMAEDKDLIASPASGERS